MKNIWKNYKSTIILLGSIILGAIIGFIFKEKATILSPFGDLFLNMLLVVIVPLIFTTIAVSVGSMKQPKRVGKILISILGVFIVMSVIAVLLGFIATRIPLVKSVDSTKIIKTLDIGTKAKNEKVNFLERTVEAISVNDFSKLLTRDNMIALIVAAVIVGLAIIKSKEKGEAFLNVLVSFNDVLQNIIQIIMYYAPIGLCCYFASFIGTFGVSIAEGFARTLVIYTLVCILIYFGLYTLYAFISGGKKGIKKYWAHITEPSLTALATCSSAACIPVNIKATKGIGVKDDISNTTIPLGTSFHKEGSAVGSVFKIMFLVYLFNADISIFKIIGVSLLATLLISAVPIGGGTISEMLILTILGFPVGALPILTIIATIIDAPATILNVVGDTSSSMLVSRLVDGKNWIKGNKKDS